MKSIANRNHKHCEGQVERKNQRGQGLVEYLLIVALIAIATIATVTYFGDTLRSQFAGIAQELSGQDGTDMRDTSVEDANRAAADGTRKRDGMSDYMNPELHGGGDGE